MTCDLVPGRGDLAIDITRIDLPDSSFERVLCSHVLEHVPDDRQALAELHRVLAPGGIAIVNVPMDLRLERTDEDPTVTDPEERRWRYWQEDHVRLYGRDFRLRLEEAGFEVEHVRPTDTLTPEQIEWQRLGRGEDVFLCHRR